MQRPFELLGQDEETEGVLAQKQSTMEKAKQVLRIKDPDLVGRAGWISGMNKLFKLRNRFVHYKDEETWVGFEFSDPLVHDMAEAKMRELHGAVKDGIRSIGECAGISTSFVDGDYSLASTPE